MRWWMPSVYFPLPEARQVRLEIYDRVGRRVALEGDVAQGNPNPVL